MLLQKQRILICVACTLMLFCDVGLANNAFSSFTPFLIGNGILTNSQASLLLTIRMLVGMVMMTRIRAYLKKFGIRFGLTLAMFFCALAFFLFSLADNFFSHCIAAVFTGLAYGLGGAVASSILLHRWFDEHLSTAVGACLAGTGAAIIVAPPVITYLIETFSLRFAFTAVSVFVLICTMTAMMLFRDRDIQSDNIGTADDDTLLIPTSHYYALLAAAFTLGIASGPGFSHLSVLFTTIGFENMTASFLVSAFGIALMIGKFFSGAMADEIGSPKTLTFFFTLLLLGGVGCCFSGIRVFIFSAVSMLFYGAGMALASVGITIFAEDVSSPGRYDKSVQQLQFATTLGSFLFSSIPGIIADHTGSYLPAYIGIFTFTAIGSIAAAFAYRKLKKEE